MYIHIYIYQSPAHGGRHYWGDRNRQEIVDLLNLGGPGDPFGQGFPGSRGSPDSTNQGFPFFCWRPHECHPRVQASEYMYYVHTYIYI